MKGKMILLVGLPASGKSTWAHERMNTWDAVGRYRVNWDELRIELGFLTFNRTQEEIMKRESFLRVMSALDNGVQEIIVDNTNLTESARGRWKFLAEQNDLKYEEIWFPITAGKNGANVELCIRRDAQREGKAQVGRAVIERMALFAGLIDIPVSLSRGTRNLVILDIDGTVANLERRREILRSKCAVCLGQGFIPDDDSALAGSDSPCGACGGKGFKKKDWYTFYSRVSQDTPISPIIDLARILRNACYRILVVSGRPISWGDLEIGKETVKWLAENNVIYDHIFMRNSGDGREDTIVKQEILDKLPKDRIAYVLDDRDSVVKMWRDNGLTCLQVASGNF